MSEDEVIGAAHDYDAQYKAGAHWEKETPSSNIPRFLEHLIKGGERILDAGCGSGRDAIYLAQQGLDVTGVDSSPLAIQRLLSWNHLRHILE